MKVEPLPFQLDAVAHHPKVIARHGASLEGSVAGFGKTFVAAFVAKQMGAQLVVCCPKVVIPHWKEACELVGVPWRAISNYEDHKPPPRRKGQEIEEKHRLGHTEMGRWEIWGRKWRWTFPKPTLLVFDEGHVLKSRTSHNAKLAIAARRQGIPTLVMSATIAQDPLDLFAVGNLLGLHDGSTHGFLGWAMQYGVRRGGFDWEFNLERDPTALDRLNAALYPQHGHRKSYADIPGFPEESTQVLAVPGDPKALAKMERAWERVAALEALKEEAPNAAVERLRARQIAELAKVPSILDLAREYVGNQQKVIIFVNFTDTIDEIHAELEWPIIDGRFSGEDYRREVIRKFQADELDGVIIQIRAGGVGISLHDTHGDFARHSIISPPEGARDLIQALGRNRRVGGKSVAFRTILTLADSIEERVHRKVSSKAQQIETINDGDLNPLNP